MTSKELLQRFVEINFAAHAVQKASFSTILPDREDKSRVSGKRLNIQHFGKRFAHLDGQQIDRRKKERDPVALRNLLQGDENVSSLDR